MASTQQIKEIFSSCLETVLSEIGPSVKRACQEEVNSAIKKKKLDEPHVFKRKFNEDQFKTNSKILDCIDAAENALNDDDKDTAKQNLTEGKKLLNERQKHILIADREDDGWKVIKHYKSDILAENSDDEKRMARSRKQASVEKKTKRKTKRH